MHGGYTELNTFRYERKFVILMSSRLATEAIIKQNSELFVSVYQPRNVNNIYFDTPGLDCYFDNLFGNGERWKARIRWYGDILGEVISPILEFKVKKGLVGTKYSFSIPNFRVDKLDFNASFFRNYFSATDLPENIVERMVGLQPVLLNSYNRSYFSTLNKKFRITVDDKLDYYNLRPTWNTISDRYREELKTVVELKYDKEWDGEAGNITTQFPFRLDKNSKFSTGMSHFRNSIAE